MTSRKLIIYQENLPYIALFDLQKHWLNLKQERLELIEQMREIRTKGYNLTMQINAIEADIGKAIQKLDKKQERDKNA